MTRDPGPDRGAVAFAERLLTVLGEGRFNATYEYAVLLGPDGSVPGALDARGWSAQLGHDGHRINWTRQITRREFNDETSFDNLIRFVGNAGDRFAKRAADGEDCHIGQSVKKRPRNSSSGTNRHAWR